MKVLLVDDHPLVLSALQAVIQTIGSDTTVVGVDSVASAKAVATIGAAAATGGMSLLGQELLANARTDPGAPCQIALGNAPKAQPEGNAAAAAPAQGIGDVGNALGKLFKR